MSLSLPPESPQHLEAGLREEESEGAPVEPWGPTEPVPAATGFPLSSALQWCAVLAIAGWIAFTYASNDNPIVETIALRTALPRTPDGWRGNMTRGSHPSEVSLGGRSQFLSSNAWRTYTRDDKEITVEIWDWAGDYPYHLPIDIPGWANGELICVGAEEGRLRYNDESKRGRLRVRYLDRFYLVVEGEGIERYELEGWYHRIDLGGLRREIDKLRRAAASR